MSRELARTRLLVIVSALILFGSRAEAQYHWHIAVPGVAGKMNYSFGAVSSWHDVCSAVALKDDTSTFHWSLVVFRSTDAGHHWTEQDSGFPQSVSYDLMSQIRVHDLKLQQIDSLNAVIVGDSGLIFRTTDGGVFWGSQQIQSRKDISCVHFSDSQTGMIGVSDSAQRRLQITHDGGLHWQASRYIPWSFADNCHSDGADAFRFIEYGGFHPLYATADDWNSADSLPPPIPSGIKHTYFLYNFLFSGKDTIFGYGKVQKDTLGMYWNPKFVRSIDGGGHWDNIPIDTLLQEPNAMTSIENDLVFCGGYCYNGYVTDPCKIAISTDHGTTWKIDTMLFDTSFKPQVTYGLTLTSSQHPIGSFGGSYPITPILAEWQTALMVGELSTAEVNPGVAALGNVQLYPNPAISEIRIFTRSPIALVDALSRSYYVPNHDGTLDVSSLPAGVYYVSDGKQRARFVKQ